MVGRGLHSVGRIALLAFVSLIVTLSGAASLVYEVMLARLMDIAFGNNTQTHGLFLAGVLGGLAVGYHVGATVQSRGKTRLKYWLGLEIWLGLWIVLGPTVIAFAGDFYQLIAPPPSSNAASVDLLIRGVIAALVIMPGTIALGATLPLVVDALSHDLKRLSTRLGWLYGLNCAGAALGSWYAGFVLLPRFGVELTLLMAGGSLVVLSIMGYGWLRLFMPPTERGRPPYPVGRRTPMLATPQIMVYVVVGLVGTTLAILGVAWFRYLTLTMGGSVHAFALMLATFIAGVGVGSLVVAVGPVRKEQIPRALQGLVVVAIASLALPLSFYDHGPYLFHMLTSVIRRMPANYDEYIQTCAVMSICLMAGPTIALGAVLPIACRIGIERAEDIGRSVGRFFGVNAIGSLAGALLASFVLLPNLGLQGTLKSGLVVLGGALVVLGMRIPGFQNRLVGIIVIIVACLLPSWQPGLLLTGLYRHRSTPIENATQLEALADSIKIPFAVDDGLASIAVVDTPRGDRTLRVNGKGEAGTARGGATQVMLGQLGVLLHDNPQRVLLAGLGSGIAAGSVLKDDRVQALMVSEPSNAAIKASQFFDDWTGQPLQNPKTTLVRRDVRNLLRVLPDDVQFDVIINQSSHPWQPGSAALYSRDVLRQMARRLAPGGIMVQLLPTFEMSRDTLDRLLWTYGSVFPQTRIFHAFAYNFVMVSTLTDFAVDFGKLAYRLAGDSVQTEWQKVRGEQRSIAPSDVLVHEMIDHRRFASLWTGRDFRMEAHSDLFPTLEFEAARDLFVGRPERYLFSADSRLLPWRRSHVLLKGVMAPGSLSAEGLLALRQYLQGRPRHLNTPLEKTLLRVATMPVDAVGEVVGPPDADLTNAAPCHERILNEFRVVDERTTMFNFPTAKRLERVLQRCQSTLPRPDWRRYRKRLAAYLAP
ncbi:MAG: hypothetical protein VX589_07860 [Myxococcota bacterium]|nr:hypothetical protein [Myxococcota bacterium]